MISHSTWAALCAAVATAGAPALPWGASPAQLESERPGTRHITRGSKLDVGVAGSRGPLQMGSRKYEATFYYGQHGLSRVDLYVPVKYCEQLAAETAAAHGRPLRVFDQTLGGRILLRILLWHDEPGRTRVRMNLGSGACGLHLEPLAVYRERDLSTPAFETKEVEVR